MANYTFTSDGFNRSIEIALRNPPHVSESIARIRRVINGLPEGTLYAAKQEKNVYFFTISDNHQKYMSKQSGLTYSLARRKYLLLLLEILELTWSNKPKDIKRREQLIIKLKNLICIYERGNLDIAKIVLTSKQYKWYRGSFRQKHINTDEAQTSSSGLPVRSKSERDIVNVAETFAVPFHYEEQRVIYVHDLVAQLEKKLKKENKLYGPLYTFRGGEVHWNVPPELEWMNARGSIWKTYYPPKGTITIYNDFTIMLADDEIIIWEHEGLMDDFIYRCNASERAAVMKYTGAVSKGNLIETYEQDVDTPEKIMEIIERRILPRMWF